LGVLLLVSVVAAPVQTCAEHGADPAWPNEPPELSLISDYGFSDALPRGSGVSINGDWSINNADLAARVGDLTAPASPPFVAQFTYPLGFGDGTAPATIFINPPPVREVYFGFVWKASDPFASHPSNVNKIAFMFPDGENGDMFLMMHKTGGPIGGGSYAICTEPEFSADTRQLCPNVATSPILLGRWYRIEWYVRFSSSPGAADGISRWWVNGVLNGDFQDIRVAGDHFVEIQFSPTYGGNTGAVKPLTDYFWVDHVHLSGR
jgi:hypothetical protein